MFLVSNFWTTIRPSSTENETESSRYPESLASGSTLVPSQSSDNSMQQLENPLQNLELSNFELKSENRKLQMDKIELNSIKLQLEKQLILAQSRNDQLEFQSNRVNEKRKFHKNMKSQELNHEFVINELKRKTEIANNDKIELENELMSFKSRIDLLEFEKKQLQDEKRKFHQSMTGRERNHQSVINELKRENETANNDRTELENELNSSQLRIEQLEIDFKRLEDAKTKVDKNMTKQESNHQSAINKLKSELSFSKSRINQLEDEKKQFLVDLPTIHSDNKHFPTAKGILKSQCHQIFQLRGSRENFGDIRKLI